MDGSTAIIITSIIGGSITLTAAFIRIGPVKKSGNGNGIRINAKDIPLTCPAHSGIDSDLKSLGRDMGDVKDDIKSINAKLDGTVLTLGEIKGMVEIMDRRRE